MCRLLIHVEGQTEETFVNEVLAPHLIDRGYVRIGARLLGNARQRARRGGIRSWPLVRSDILKHLHENRGSLSTTMVDYYGLPRDGDRAWPGRAQAAGLSYGERASCVESAMVADICGALGGDPNRVRFVPYIVMHEFEGLLFSDCGKFAAGIGRPELEASFRSVRVRFASPEEINDSPLTAPSKRVMKLVPGYEKPLLGTLAALEIGLAAIRRECPSFNRWIERLEAWPGNRM